MIVRVCTFGFLCQTIIMKNTFVASVQKHIQGGWPEDSLGYRVHVGKYTYYVRITPEKDRYGNVIEYAMDLGGRKRGCVSIRIPTLASAIPGRSDATQAVLKYVQFNAMCSANRERDLVSGFGTKHMLKTALYFAKTLCPNTDIKSFRFMDVSHKLCTDGVSIDLPYFMIALYGKTYYEKYYFARLNEPSDDEQYKAALLGLQSVPHVTLPFDTFASKFMLTEQQASSLQHLYESADTFTAFFQRIREHYADTICQMMNGWINRFVVKWLFSDRDFTSRFWSIPANRIPEMNVPEWEVVSVDSVDMHVLNREQHGGCRDDQYLGVWDSNED